MNRPIKFRCWEDYSKCMLQPEYINDDGTPLWFDIDSQTLCNYGPVSELMQFTGLLDRNGKEVYEGDVVQRSGQDYGLPVTFKDGEWTINENGNLHTAVNAFSYEVIGNVFSNPELLEESNAK